MRRLRRFPDNRYIGTRDDMVVWDCDDDVLRTELEERIASEGLLDGLRLQSFAPDELSEARNRGFRP